MSNEIKYAITNEVIKYAIINDVIKYAITNDIINKRINNIFVFPNMSAQLMLDVSCLFGTVFFFVLKFLIFGSKIFFESFPNKFWMKIYFYLICLHKYFWSYYLYLKFFDPKFLDLFF